MRKIKIDINNARIEGFAISLKENGPEMTATVALMAGEKKISSFSLGTQSYHDENARFNIPPMMIATIIDMANQLENILAEKCETSMMQLEAGNAIG